MVPLIFHHTTDSFSAYAAVTGREYDLKKWLDFFQKNYQTMISTNSMPVPGFDGMFVNVDNRDGMEGSIGGKGALRRAYRPTLNSYMYAEAAAISRIAQMAKKDSVQKKYAAIAVHLRNQINERLWDPIQSFFKAVPLPKKGNLSE
jgi:hypothetical protein